MRHEGLEAVRHGPRQPLACDDALDGSRAPQVGHRLIEQHEGDRRDDDQELRADPQL
jgi:hypothetical protein